MKTIYMEETILIMSKEDPQSTQELISKGEIKKTQEGKPYLVIRDEE
jgi:hypothetical protein